MKESTEQVLIELLALQESSNNCEKTAHSLKIGEWAFKKELKYNYRTLRYGKKLCDILDYFEEIKEAISNSEEIDSDTLDYINDFVNEYKYFDKDKTDDLDLLDLLFEDCKEIVKLYRNKYLSIQQIIDAFKSFLIDVNLVHIKISNFLIEHNLLKDNQE